MTENIIANCSVCGTGLIVVNKTDEFVLIRPCRVCIDFEVKKKVDELHKRYWDHIYNLLNLKNKETKKGRNGKWQTLILLTRRVWSLTAKGK